MAATLFPALAVARELVHTYGAQVRFVGTARGLETRLVPAAGFPLDLIQVGQLNQVRLSTKLATLSKLPLGVLACRRLMRKFKPHVVFGVGGYASGPAMMAAILSGTPRVAFEPNAVPGMVNRWVGRWVQAAAVNFPDTLRYFRNGHVTGIPVRPEFFELPPRPIDAPPQLLVFGGSQGARMLNRMMPQIAADLACRGAGTDNSSPKRSSPFGGNRAGLSAIAGVAWEVGRLVESRAVSRRYGGALWSCQPGAVPQRRQHMAELAAARKPSLLIPFPRAADDHQRCNAEVFVQAGAAVMIEEAELTPQRLLEELIRLLKDPEGLAAMAQKARCSGACRRGRFDCRADTKFSEIVDIIDECREGMTFMRRLIFMRKFRQTLTAALVAASLIVAALAAGVQNAGAEKNGVDRTPVLGWSSWSFIREQPTAAKLEAQAQAMQSSGLQKLGYEYINLDDFWEQCPGPQGPNVDPYGRWVTDPSRFPVRWRY